MNIRFCERCTDEIGHQTDGEICWFCQLDDVFYDISLPDYFTDDKPQVMELKKDFWD